MTQAPKQSSTELAKWKFQFQESGLSPSAEIDKLAQDCKLFKAPSIVFNSNYLILSETQHNFKLTYNAHQALKLINFQRRKEKFVGIEEKAEINSISYLPAKLKVKYAKQWQSLEKPKDIEITEIDESSDSFYITPFKGHIQGVAKVQRVDFCVIPVDKLGPENPIIIYKQGSIYEDELDDNGLIQYQYKFRTMQKSWFALIRCYARVDEVIVMILDTRIYWEEGWNKIARQFSVRQNSWEELKEKGFQFKAEWNMNPNQSHLVYQLLEERFTENQYVHYA